MVTRLVELKEIPGLIQSGQIGHSLVVAAFYHYQSWRAKPSGVL
jgi:hypothetical protein